jgi:hypothetical protein
MVTHDPTLRIWPVAYDQGATARQPRALVRDATLVRQAARVNAATHHKPTCCELVAPTVTSNTTRPQAPRGTPTVPIPQTPNARQRGTTASPPLSASGRTTTVPQRLPPANRARLRALPTTPNLFCRAQRCGNLATISDVARFTTKKLNDA